MKLSGHLGNKVGKLKKGGIWKENTKGFAQKANWVKANSPKTDLVFSSQKLLSQISHLRCSTWKPPMGA